MVTQKKSVSSPITRNTYVTNHDDDNHDIQLIKQILVNDFAAVKDNERKFTNYLPRWFNPISDPMGCDTKPIGIFPKSDDPTKVR
jgi:hypothetical protein